MKIKIEDLTIKQVCRICENYETCSGCPITDICYMNECAPRYFELNKKVDVPEELLK